MPEEKQTKLFDLPIDRQSAELIAEEEVLGELGSVPNIGGCREDGNLFIFDIEASFPRVLIDEVTSEPRKTRFIEIGKVGEIAIDRMKGRVVKRPRFYDVSNAIDSKLRYVTDIVDKALVRVAADEFSLLPFPIHLHTPVVDVISWLLINDRLKLGDIHKLTDESERKLLTAIEPLHQLRIIEIKNEIVVPGPILIGIEGQYSKPSEQLSKSLAYFFRSGYSFIESIRQVLGPHLRLSSILYERSFEVEEVVPLSIRQIEQDFMEFYAKEKQIKLPRYLVQLEGIGLAEMVTQSGIPMWQGRAEILESLKQDELVEPLSGLML